jgi:hypothetical protein
MRQLRNRVMSWRLEAQLDIFPAVRTHHVASGVFGFKLNGLSAVKARTNHEHRGRVNRSRQCGYFSALRTRRDNADIFKIKLNMLAAMGT